MVSLTPLRFWCQKILPAVYDDSLSYYELLCKVVDKLNEVVANTNELSDGYETLSNAVNELNVEFEKFKESGFQDYYEKQIEAWIDANMAYIFAKFIKVAVFFGLTDNGYFCAYVPDSWDDIVFDTGAVYGNTDYGCLILKY